MTKTRFSILFLLLLSVQLAYAQPKLARLFSDHVVLQRQKPIPVWGWAKAGEKVTVSLAGQTANTKAGADGKWIVRLPQLEAGGPHILTVTAKSGKATVSDILIGEVWLCSGQSNMEWPVSRAADFEKEKLNADYPQIRHFRVEHELSLTPETDLTTGEWKVSSAETVGSFTAVGFFFAREIYNKLRVPVGLLHSSWGGSQIEAWISKEAMASDPELASYTGTLPKTWEDFETASDTKLKLQLFKKDGISPTVEDEKSYTSGKADFSVWQNAADPIGQWDRKGFSGFRGNGYMGKNFEVSASLASKETTLQIPENDSQNEIYVNGKLIASIQEKGVKKIKVPAGSWKTGDNQLVIKFGNMVSQAFFGPGLSGKASDLLLTDGVQTIDLSQNWKLIPSFSDKHTYVRSANSVGTTIYNAMIEPLIPFGLRGALWYQGETNAGRAYQYRTSFPLMINDWRTRWKDEFSFYWAQLSTFGPENDSNKGSAWAELREAQTLTLKQPKTGMAVITDIGNPADIHPTNKQDVGHRLAINALKWDYSQNITYSSPLYNDVKFEGGKANVTFKFAERGLKTNDKYGYVKGFEIAGADKVFYFAKAEITPNGVTVYSDKVAQPVAVRYAWSDSPVDANLASTEGLPVDGFRTDTWPGITVNNKFK